MTALADDTGMTNSLTVRKLATVDYVDSWQQMQAFNARQTETTADELWLCNHPPVITLGMRCKTEPAMQDNSILILATDRGGEATYHGPGQIVAYVMIQLRRRGWGVKTLVQKLEQSVIDLLAQYQIEAERHSGAPGVYVRGKKIAALGLRVKNGGSYHGIALNVDMDLAPFSLIDPCGNPNLEVTQVADLTGNCDIETIQEQLIHCLADNLGYNYHQLKPATETFANVKTG